MRASEVRRVFGEMPWETLQKRVARLERGFKTVEVEEVKLKFDKIDGALAGLTKAVNDVVGKVAALEQKVAELSADEGDQAKLDGIADVLEDAADKLGTTDAGASTGGITA